MVTSYFYLTSLSKNQKLDIIIKLYNVLIWAHLYIVITEPPDPFSDGDGSDAEPTILPEPAAAASPAPDGPSTSAAVPRGVHKTRAATVNQLLNWSPTISIIDQSVWATF